MSGPRNRILSQKRVTVHLSGAVAFAVLLWGAMEMSSRPRASFARKPTFPGDAVSDRSLLVLADTLKQPAVLSRWSLHSLLGLGDSAPSRMLVLEL